MAVKLTKEDVDYYKNMIGINDYIFDNTTKERISYHEFHAGKYELIEAMKPKNK